jgi:VCBS repeat-containing protein
VGTDTASVNGYGTYTVTAGGTWTYTLANTNGSVNALNDSDTLTDTFIVATEDGTLQTVTVTITGTNDAAVITTSATQSVDENSAFSVALTSTDVDGITPATFTITGGADQALFDIDGGNLTMTAKDYEIPIDNGGNNIYEVEVTANDGFSNTVKTIAVNVNDVDEISPTVVNVDASYGLITEGNVGVDTFSIAVDFNEEMDTNFTPTLTFSEVVSGSITNGSGLWSNSNQTYTVTYDVLDNDVDLTNIIVDVTGGQDTSGNVQLNYTALPEFSIDTIAPAAPAIDLLDDSGSDSNDDITKINQPTIRVNLNFPGGNADPVAGDVVRLYSGVTQVGIATLFDTDITNGYIDITTSSTLSDNTHDITSTITDGNGNESSASPILPVTIDTQVATLGVTLDTDVGNNFQGSYTVSGTETGAVLEYSTDNISWSPFTGPTGDASSAGDYSFYIRQTDLAGNTSGGTLLEFTNGSSSGETLEAGVGGVYDIITGGGGNDILKGNASDNTLYGDGGDDEITGGTGTNTLYGGDGDDTFIGGSGADAIDGGNHSSNGDTVDYSSDTAGVTISLVNGSGSGSGGDANGDTYSNIENLIGGSGVDILTGDVNGNILRGGGDTDTLTGGGGTNTLYGGADSDTFIGGAGDDAFYGDNDETDNNDTDADTVSYASDGAGISASLTTGSGATGIASGDTYSDIENLIGGSGADTLEGDSESNTLTGGGGIDTLKGMAGNDTLYGGTGDDFLYGGLDNDILEGGSGGDELWGGGGNDTVSYASGGAVFTSLLNPVFRFGDAAGDFYDSIENLTGSDQGDILEGDGGANILDGGQGDDTLTGGDGNDTLYADQGSDTAKGEGGDDIIQISSGTLPNSIDGGTGTDTIKIDALINTTYDLTDLAGKTTSVEILDISGSDGTTIEVTALDIQNMVDDAGNHLIIKADASDTLVLDTDGVSMSPGFTGDDSTTYTFDGGATILWEIV